MLIYTFSAVLSTERVVEILWKNRKRKRGLYILNQTLEGWQILHWKEKRHNSWGKNSLKLSHHSTAALRRNKNSLNANTLEYLYHHAPQRAVGELLHTLRKQLVNYSHCQYYTEL